MSIEIIPVRLVPIVKDGDDLGQLIVKAILRQGTPLEEGDVVVVSHIIVSRAEGRVVDLRSVSSSPLSRKIGTSTRKDPRLVEIILTEAKSIVRIADGRIITETDHGFICANSGVDRSNVPGEHCVATLPRDPDESARRIGARIKEILGKEVAVIISDTHGRPFREGAINVAIGVAGLRPILDRRGEKDLFGYVLKAKQIAIADEIASAAELVMGQANEGVPVAVVRGYRYPSGDGSSSELVRPKEKDLFV